MRPEHALEAIAAAAPTRLGEGAVGAGTGTTCFGYKAGHRRRLAPDRSARARLPGLLQLRGQARPAPAGRPGASEAPGRPEPPGAGGSIVIVLGTDAPLSERQLRRLAARATFGLGRAGGFGANASGEYALAFSTAQRIPHRSEADELQLRFLRDDSRGAARAVRGHRGGRARGGAELALRGGARWRAATATALEALPYELLERAPGLRR